MTLHSLTDALADSAALQDIAKKAGVTLAQARLIVASLGDLPAPQVVRLFSIAHADRLRSIHRAQRRDGR